MSERATPETDDQPIIYAINDNGYQVPCVDIEFARKLARELDEAFDLLASEKTTRNHIIQRGIKMQQERDEAMAIGQELADIASHCLGWHIDVAGNFKSDHTLGLSRKITDTLQRWSKLKEAVK